MHHIHRFIWTKKPSKRYFVTNWPRFSLFILQTIVRFDALENQSKQFHEEILRNPNSRSRHLKTSFGRWWTNIWWSVSFIFYLFIDINWLVRIEKVSLNDFDSLSKQNLFVFNVDSLDERIRLIEEICC